MRTTLEVDRLSKDRIAEHQRNARQYQLWKSSRPREALPLWRILTRRIQQEKRNKDVEELSILRDLATAESDSSH
jgi:hypothetical protein